MNKRLLPKSVDEADSIQHMGTANQAALGPVIRCLVWNIFKAKRSHWLADFKALTADRDLVCFQEAVVNAPSDDAFASSQRFEWVMAGSHEHPQSGVVTGVKTGCVTKPLKQTVHRSNYSEPVLKTQKLLLETHYAITDSTHSLMVLNMHAINFVSVKKFVDQLDQLSMALGYHDGPILLAGDFNTWSPKRLSHFIAMATDAGLTEAGMQRRVKMRHLNAHLDHVFYRGLSLMAVESLEHVTSSDHAPITASFKIE